MFAPELGGRGAGVGDTKWSGRGRLWFLLRRRARTAKTASRAARIVAMRLSPLANVEYVVGSPFRGVDVTTVRRFGNESVMRVGPLTLKETRTSLPTKP